MGVHGLWKLLESTGKPINPETLEGKILAVDISIWLNQAVKGVRDREGSSVHNAHLLTLFHRLCKLLFFRIKPIFVFDGDAPLLKRQTLAIRRQRKEELNLESKQTNEKLLKTFLKRQAIKAALGDRSQDPLPSISSVRRDEVDDMYVLPALPPTEEKGRNSSEEEEDTVLEDMADNHRVYQEELYDNPNSVDINSEEFASLPPEMKHEILKDMKEFSKRRRTMYHKPPECSGDFSQYQLAGLLQRNQLNQRLEGVEKEMSQRSAGDAPQLYDQEDGEHSVESRRLLSEDTAHYILIKGTKKNKKVAESQPAALPWAGGPLSGKKRCGAEGRPEPLWRPISEESPEDTDEALKPPVLTPSVSTEGDTAPPSPRTLKAIQAAMTDSSDEEEDVSGWEKGAVGNKGRERCGGDVSPRTLLAIQQAMAEEEDEVTAQSKGLIGSSPTKPRPHTLHAAPSLVISSSKDELTEANEPHLRKTLAYQEKPMLFENPSEQLLCPADCVLVSSSEEEMEEALEQRNKALHSAALGDSRLQTGMEAGMTTQKEERHVMLEEQGDSKQQAVGGGQVDMEVEKEIVTTQGGCSVDSSVPLSQPTLPLNGNPKAIASASPAKNNGDNSETEKEKNNEVLKTEDSDSEESFVEVSEGEELKEEDADNWTRVESLTSEFSDDGAKREEEEKEEEEEKGFTEDPEVVHLEENKMDKEESDEKEVKDVAGAGPTVAPVPNEWEHIDTGELEELEISLEAQQARLREQKQQQERSAATVTGQMCMESQELLRLFGVPYMVAPMEAEAQCAALDRHDHTHGTITDDSDVWLFGGRHVYKNFFSQNKYVEHYQYSDMQNQLGLDRTKLINLAYLLGSDYTEGIPGVGHVTGMEILNEFPGPGMEPLLQFSEWWSKAQENKRLTSDPRDSKVRKKARQLKLQPGFPNPCVLQAYLQPAVDQSDGDFSWGRPHVDLLKEFCQSRFGWTSRKTEETLQPVIKQLNTQQSQLRIDSFFRLEQQERQAIRSQRLRRAVTCLKRKEREEGEDEEEESPSPSKEKTGNAAVTKQKKGRVEVGVKGSVGGGGFLGESDVTTSHAIGSLENVGGTHLDETPSLPPNKGVPVPKPLPLRVRQSSSSGSSSSGEDSDGNNGAAMVTACSVFKGKPGSRGRRGNRGRGKGRGKKTK